VQKRTPMRTIPGERLRSVVGGWRPQGHNNYCIRAIDRAADKGMVAGWGVGIVGSTAATVKTLSKFPPKTRLGGVLEAGTAFTAILGGTALGKNVGEYLAGSYAKATDPDCK